MKQIRFDNNRTSSGRNSRILATRQMLHRVVAALVLMLVSVGAWAADYVFMNGDNYIIIDNSGAITTTNTFSPSTCLWSGTSGGAFTNNGKTLKYSQNSPSGSGTFYYTTTLNTTGTDVPLDIAGDGTIQFTANESATYRNFVIFSYWDPTPGTWYIQNNSGSIVASTTSSSNNVKAYAVTTEPYLVTEQNPVLTGGGEITVIGESSPCTITQEARHATGTNYKFNGADHKIPDTPEETFTNQWTLTGISSDYATINSSTGAITYKASPDEDITASVKVKATGNKGTTLESNTISVTFKAFHKFYYTATAKAATDGVESTEGGTVTGATSGFVLGQQYNSTSASKEVTFTATPKTGYQFVGWGTSATATTYESNNATYTFTISMTTAHNSEANAASKTLYAIFKPLPKFYYQVVPEVVTEYAVGSTQTGTPGGTATVTPGSVQMVYGATLNATSATVSSSFTLKATADAAKSFGFKEWRNATGTQVSTNATYNLSLNSITVNSQDENNPTKVVYKAVFGEYPIFYFKLNATAKEYTSAGVMRDADGSDIKATPALNGNMIAKQGTSLGQTSLTTDIELQARVGEGFGFRGWSATEVTAANIETGPYASTSKNYTLPSTSSATDPADATAQNIYAYFQELPLIYFEARAEVLEVASYPGVVPGTASVNPATVTGHATSFTNRESSTTVTYSATENTGFKFGGWYRKESDDSYTLLSNYNPYVAKIKSDSDDPDNPDVTTLYAQYLCNAETIEAEDIELDTESDGWLKITVTPEDAWKSYIITSGDPGLVYVDNSGHCRTNLEAGTTTITIQAVKTDGSTPSSLLTTVNAKVRIKCKRPEIAIEPNSSDAGATATATLALLEGSPEADIFYSFDPDAEKPWTKYTAPVTMSAGQTIYAYSMKLKDGVEDNDYTRSDVAEMVYQKPKVATPTLKITKDGITFESETAGPVTYYYVVNDAAGGADPVVGTSQSWTTGGSAITGVVNEKYIKVIGTKTGYDDSDITEQQYIYASGTYGGTVYLNDYEDHTWTYYAGVDESVDDGNYNTNYVGKIYSPNPRNVKITYKGNGQLTNGTAVTGVKVGIDAPETTFVYYKTIENNNGYKYNTIPNPFSVRPKVSNTYYGFSHWKVTKVSGGSIMGLGTGNTVNAETEITFVPSGTYTTNCTSMEVELEAVWDVAEVSTNGTFSKGYNSVERNFYIVSNSTDNNLPVVGTRCTYTSFYPNGTTNGTTNATMNNRNTRRGNFTCTADTKVEYLILAYNNNGTINADAHNLTIGRGCSPASGTSSNQLYGMSNKNVNSPKFHLRVESGSYNYMSFYGGYYNNEGGNGGNSSTIGGSEANLKITMGSDYDRAAGVNTNLTMKYAMTFGRSCTFSSRSNRDNLHTLDLTLKSGRLGTAFFMEGTNTANYLQGGAGYGHYISSGGSQTNVGCRNILIQGGEFCTIGSGIDAYNNGGNNNDTYNSSNRNRLAYNLRMTGGIVHGNIYGGAAQSPAGGNRVMIVTGGQVKGWFAAGCNGTSDDGGQTYGTSWVYIGGNGKIDSEGSTKKLGYASGGNVYAAGAGRQNASTCGEMTFGTNLVIADNCYVERGAYGGGNYGYAKASTNIYITGGTNEGKVDTQAGDAKGGVFAGANQQDGPEVKIWMTGGKMLGGVYGGCNTKGTIASNVTMQINGGQVGTPDVAAGIYGGGYGTQTVVSGDVKLTLGATDVDPEEVPGVKVYGNVYGGSALGKVNGSGTTFNDSKKTDVIINSGSVLTTKGDEKGLHSGNVFGGGMGDGTAQNGIVNGKITVTVNATDPAPAANKYALHGVFGGGDQAAYKDTPVVTVNNCNNSIEYVYGGGNAADVAGSDVTIHGGNIIGNVFGGCYGANVNGDVVLNIDGGHILKAFGGNNAKGTVTGDITLNVDQAGYTSNTSCPIVMDYLYGGGNNADSKTAQMNIGYVNHIGYVFGGACSANMTGDIDLQIVAGNIDNVFGGNDQLGDITGDIKVTVNWLEGTHDGVEYLRENNSIGNVYGGGNIAQYTGNPTVLIRNCDLTGNVFAGGKGDSKDNTYAKGQIIGNPTVIIGDWDESHLVSIDGDVYGGGDAARVTGNTTVTINDCSTYITGDVYGGGNAAPVGSSTQLGATNVTVWGGTINRVFGGGHGYPETGVGADVFGNTAANVFGGTIGGIFGGSNSVGDITGEAHVFLEQQLSPYDVDGDEIRATEECEMVVQEVYGAGNQAEMKGEPILTIGCVDELGEIYGGARAADIDRDIVLNIKSGTYRKVYGGNNISGKIGGTITVNIEETGCHPIVIGELYGGGNQAPYEAPVDEDGVVKTSPVVNVISCTSIGTVFGGGYGEEAVVEGSTQVNVNMVEGDFSNRVKNKWKNKLGTIGAIFGGGNAANVNGNTEVRVGNEEGKNANIDGNVYGGGNQADVTGKTKVQIGPEPTE